MFGSVGTESAADKTNANAAVILQPLLNSRHHFYGPRSSEAVIETDARYGWASMKERLDKFHLEVVEADTDIELSDILQCWNPSLRSFRDNQKRQVFMAEWIRGRSSVDEVTETPCDVVLSKLIDHDGLKQSSVEGSTAKGEIRVRMIAKER